MPQHDLEMVNAQTVMLKHGAYPATFRTGMARGLFKKLIDAQAAEAEIRRTCTTSVGRTEFAGNCMTGFLLVCHAKSFAETKRQKQEGK